MMSIQSTALPDEDDVTVIGDKTVLRLSSPARSDPLPVFQVEEVSLASASIHDCWPQSGQLLDCPGNGWLAQPVWRSHGLPAWWLF
jgi:hypothetical protein